MSESKHTPGPWEVDEDGTIYHRPNPLTKYCIADMQSGLQGNARLILASPEMYRALNEALTILLHNPDAAQPPRYRNLQASKVIKAAIAKAEGRS